MNSQHKKEQVTSILTHYFRRLTEASGLRWTERNQEDMEQLAALVCGDEEDEEVEDPRPRLLPVEEHIDDKDWINRRAEAVGYVPVRRRK